MLTCFSIMSQAQTNDTYNSICLFHNDTTSTIFLSSQIDSITHSAGKQQIWIADSIYENDVNNLEHLMLFNPYVEGIISCMNNIGDWDKGYWTSVGYFKYKNSLMNIEHIDAENFELLHHEGFDGSLSTDIVFSKSNNLPLWLILDDEIIVHFTYYNDSLCALSIQLDDFVYDIAEIEYNNETLQLQLRENNYTDELKRCLFYVVTLMNCDLSAYNSLSLVLERFRKVLEDNYLDTNLDDSKNKAFGATCFGSKDNKVNTKVFYSLYVKTGGSKNITDKAALCDGSIKCANSSFRTCGEYGILCDKDPSNLTVDKAQFKVPGNQEKLSLSFKVNVSGLDASTTYYYCAYYKFTSNKTDNIYIKYKDSSIRETYGKVKSFTTLPPDISGTWNCTETHYLPSGTPHYISYTLTLNRDGTVNHSELDELNSSWYLSKDGKVVIKICNLATANNVSGVDWNGKVDNMKRPTTITGYTSRWNSNHIGFFQGDAYDVVMTR